MAIKIKHKRSKGGGGKYDTPAPGNGPNTGEPRSLAPTRPAAPDVISTPRAGVQAFYGMPGGHNPSSIGPGETLMAPLSANHKSSSDDGEGVLDMVIAKGIAGRGDNFPADDSDRLRPMSDVSYAPSFGMKRQQADLDSIGRADLPKSIEDGASDAQSRRDAAVKRVQ